MVPKRSSACGEGGVDAGAILYVEAGHEHVGQLAQGGAGAFVAQGGHHVQGPDWRSGARSRRRSLDEVPRRDTVWFVESSLDAGELVPRA